MVLLIVFTPLYHSYEVGLREDDGDVLLNIYS